MFSALVLVLFLHSLREASDFDPRHEYGDSAAADVFLLAAKTQARTVNLFAMRY